MAVIDRDQLYADTVLYLPDSNVLSEAEIRNINSLVITNQIPADDDIYYAEALCKSLRAAAIVNKSKYSVDEKGTRRENVGQVEIEYFESGTDDPWSGYVDSLNDLCPIFGYTPNFGNSTIGIKINSGDKPNPLEDCECPTTTTHL